MFRFRNRWARRALIGLVGAAVLTGGLAACGHRGDHQARWGTMTEADAAELKSKVVGRIGSRLDLDEAQKAKLGVLADRIREQRNAFVAGGDPRAEVRGLFEGTTFDRTKAQALVSAKTAAIGGKSPEVIAALGDFFDSLNPEQQRKVREFLDQRGGRRGWRG